MKKFITVNGKTLSPAYIKNTYYMGNEEITLEVLVSDKKSYAPECIELSEASEKLVEKTIKELAEEAKKAKEEVKKAKEDKPVKYADKATSNKVEKSLV